MNTSRTGTPKVLPCLLPKPAQHDKEFEKFDNLVNRLFTEIMLEFYKEQRRSNTNQGENKWQHATKSSGTSLVDAQVSSSKKVSLTMMHLNIAVTLKHLQQAAFQPTVDPTPAKMVHGSTDLSHTTPDDKTMSLQHKRSFGETQNIMNNYKSLMTPDYTIDVIPSSLDVETNIMHNYDQLMEELAAKYQAQIDELDQRIQTLTNELDHFNSHLDQRNNNFELWHESRYHMQDHDIHDNIISFNDFPQEQPLDICDTCNHKIRPYKGCHCDH